MVSFSHSCPYRRLIGLNRTIRHPEIAVVFPKVAHVYRQGLLFKGGAAHIPF